MSLVNMGTTYTLKRGTLSAVLREDDVTADNLARIFKITQSSVYLTSDQGISIFPSEGGFFSCVDLIGGVTYQVMGDDMGVVLPNQVASFPSNPGPSRPRFSFTRSASATAVRPCSQSPKVFQRTIFLGQLEGEKLIQDKALVIPFEESEACLKTITQKVKEALNMGADEVMVLTDSQGHLLLDTPGTTGSAYWKQSSRRIFAVKDDVFAEMGRRKRRKVCNTSRIDGLGLGDLKDLIEEVVIAADGLPAVSAKIREVCKQSEGLTRQQWDMLRTSFKCNVCRGVMDSPVLARCCRSLIGCRNCVNTVIQGGQGCVKCRSEISAETVVHVAGLSEVLNVIRSMEV